MGRFGLFQAGYSRCIVGSTIEVKSAPSSLSRSPTPCRFKHSHLASRVSQGERLVARVHAHPRSMGPKMDSLLYAILGSDRQILRGVEARSVMPAVWSATRAFPLLLPPSNGRPPPSWRDEKPRLRSWE